MSKPWANVSKREQTWAHGITKFPRFLGTWNLDISMVSRRMYFFGPLRQRTSFVGSLDLEGYVHISFIIYIWHSLVNWFLVGFHSHSNLASLKSPLLSFSLWSLPLQSFPTLSPCGNRGCRFWKVVQDTRNIASNLVATHVRVNFFSNSYSTCSVRFGKSIFAIAPENRPGLPKTKVVSQQLFFRCYIS